MIAPSCPVSTSQKPYYHSLFRGSGTDAPTMPAIPAAHDLPSLIRTVNVIRDVLRQLTTSKVTNNLYLPRPPNFSKKGDKYYSQFPNWRETAIEREAGWVYHKKKGGEKDPTIRAAVIRQQRVHFLNDTQEDPEFVWTYSKKLDAPAGGPLDDAPPSDAPPSDAPPSDAPVERSSV